MRFALFGLTLLLGACAGAERGIEPRIASESECRTAQDPARCRLASDLAGGPPMSFGGQ